MTMDTPASIPAITGPQMAEIDRIMLEEFGVASLQLMEVAGRAVALFVRRHLFGGDATGRRIAILAGRGGNGGDGMVSARYLQCWGAKPELWLSAEPDSARGLAAHQLDLARRFDVTVHPPTSTPQFFGADLIIDALLGFSLSGPPTGVTAALIDAANASDPPVLAVDLPSGLDATSGAILNPCIRANTTLTLALPKTGHYVPEARPYIGELVVADIGVPAAAYARLGVTVGPLFSRDEFLPVS